MSENSRIKTAIKASLLKAKKIFEDKNEAINRISSLFSEVQEEMNNEIVFETSIISEGGQYITYGVFARNGNFIDNPKKLLLRYSFGKPNSFPMEIDLPGYGIYACSSLSEVNDTLETIIGIEDFALNIIAISEEEEAGPYIPF
jgi:hypothetical protein